ncbi:unnamed protein product [Prorocentrum cordatum]|uniref:ILEI/PANDER domain-containing protein n=1 Tax=Prorocentrum cordatum TaxID=2364126 RepID=A0ABN9VUV9_9DINO|nr:unnamed protein product [Polarella glacialis]
MLSARRALLAALTLLRLRGSPPPDGAEEAVGGAACKAARVSSLGRDADPENRGDVRFWLGGEELAVETSRGVNLVVVSPKTQEVVSAQAYDTWSQPGPESGRLRSDLEALPEGQVVLMGVNDTGMMEAMREQLAEALGSVGVTHLEHTFRASYALIGSKGGPAVAEDQASDRVAEVAGRIPCSAGCSIARVVSKEGFLQDGLPAFFLGGQRLEPELAAGISIVTFDPVSEEATGARSFPADADAQAEGGLSSYVASLPSDTIALVAVSGVRLSSLRRDTVRVLTALGASEPLLGRQGHEGYALIGSKGGWAVAEGVGEPAVVEGPLPCHGPGGVPTELPRGSGDFPGSSAEESNAAWPGGWQPQTLAEWPKDDYGAPEPCWKITVLRDVAGGWPGRCADLEPVGDGGAGPEACARLCRQSARCSAWRFGPGGCRHGQGVACDAAGDWERGAASQRLQRGEVRVLKKLERLEVVGLLRLSFESGARGSHSGALSHCREWCYSSIYCQYWQFSSRGECFVEAPSINESAAHYPLIVGLGARIEGSAAESMVEGEYIQHFCPPRPLSLREAQVVINRHVHEPEWWLEERPRATPGPAAACWPAPRAGPTGRSRRRWRRGPRRLTPAVRPCRAAR